MTDLKPCPFCGSKNLRIPKEFNYSVDGHLNGIGTNVCCNDCGSSGPTIRFVDDIVKGWNNRFDCNQVEEIIHPQLPFGMHDKIFITVDPETEEVIGEPYSQNDWLKMIKDISGVNSDLLGLSQ